MPGGRDLQQEDIWEDRDDDNPRIFDIGLEDG
jgi:hypothetical protein